MLAWIAAGEGRYDRAAHLLGILRTVWETIGAPLSGYGHLSLYHDECKSCTRAALDVEIFDTAVGEGAGWPYDGALAYALGEEQLASAGPEPSPLTPRETQIAQLIAEGMSNREIATRLVIVQRTAEGHVEHILNKLGFNSRAQIAAWVGRQKRARGGEDRGG